MYYYLKCPECGEDIEFEDEDIDLAINLRERENQVIYCPCCDCEIDANRIPHMGRRKYKWYT